MAKWIRSRNIPCAVAMGFLLELAALSQPMPAVSPLKLGSYMVVPCNSATASAPIQAAGSSSTYCLERSPVFDQRDVSSAALTDGAKNGPVIELTLRDPVARRFSGITGNAIGRQIAIVLNGRLICAPTIQASTQHPLIYGLTLPEAGSVVDALNHGAVAQAAPPPPAPGNK
jgi:preprotein translocase subunit SecD